MENTGGGIGKRSEMRDADDFANAFSAMKRERAGGSHHAKSPLIQNQLNRIVSLAAKSRLPARFDDRAFTEAGGFMSYGANLVDLDWCAAVHVERS